MNMQRRRSIRLQTYDYTRAGAYFITVCTARRECLFGQIRDGAMFSNAAGECVARAWNALPQRYQCVALDAFVVMPNHIHGVIRLGDSADASAPGPQVSRSLGDIVRAFKSLSAVAVNRVIGRQGRPLWQRNYYERIIRDDEEWNRVREYIARNPTRWDDDAENPSRSRP
jgi:REP element-mobilizing transposase RayT